jgi:hypothetical protein
VRRQINPIGISGIEPVAERRLTIATGQLEPDCADTDESGVRSLFLAITSRPSPRSSPAR